MKYWSSVFLALVVLSAAEAQAWEYLNSAHPVWCDVPRVRMLAPGSDDLGLEVSESEVRRAFDAWAAPECTTLRYEYLGTTTQSGNRFDYDSLILWDETTDWGTDAVGATTVHSSPATEAGNSCIRSADIQLRGFDRAWTTDASLAKGNVLYTFNVLAHEVGHLLGLGHSADKSALMYTYGSVATPSLTEDDVAGVCALYGESGSIQDCSVEGCPNDMFCREGLCLSAGARCGGPFGCEDAQSCVALNAFSYCLDLCDFRVSAACAHEDRFCSPRMGDGSAGYCMPGKPGHLADGAPCGEDFQCGSGMCHEGACRTACTNHDDCADGTRCTVITGVGACLPALPFAAACSDSAACLSGLCFDDEAQGSSYCSITCGGAAACPEGARCLSSRVCSLAAWPEVEDADAGTAHPGVPASDSGIPRDPEESLDGSIDAPTTDAPEGLRASSLSAGGCSVVRPFANGASPLVWIVGVAFLLRRKRAAKN
jgi:hypothetical protein